MRLITSTSLAVLILAFVLAAQSSSLADYRQAIVEATELEGRGDMADVVEKLRPWVERFPQQAQGRHHLGIALYQLQDYGGAIEHLSEALKLEAENSPAWRQTAEHLGLAYYFSHRTKDASPLLAEALQWKEDDTYLRYALAMCHVYNNKPEDARSVFAELYGINPESAQAALLASHFMNRENFGPEAEELVRRAQEIDPSLPDLNYRLGVIALTKGDHKEGAARFREELKRNPLHPMAWHYLGEAQAQAGELDDAVASLERAIWLNLRNVPSYLLIAGVYNRQEKYALAENALQQALSFDPQNYEARFLLARIYQKTDRLELAKQEMARARQLRKSGP